MLQKRQLVGGLSRPFQNPLVGPAAGLVVPPLLLAFLTPDPMALGQCARFNLMDVHTEEKGAGPRSTRGPGSCFWNLRTCGRKRLCSTRNLTLQVPGHRMCTEASWDPVPTGVCWGVGGGGKLTCREGVKLNHGEESSHGAIEGVQGPRRADKRGQLSCPGHRSECQVLHAPEGPAVGCHRSGQAQGEC